MTGSPVLAEYSRRAKREGSFALRCFFTVLLWVALAIGAVAVTAAVAGSYPSASGYAAAFAAACILAVILPTSAYLNLEYDYIISSGVMTVSAIYGKRKRRVIIEFDIKKATLMAPYTEEAARKIEQAGAAKTYYTLSEKASKEAYCALFKNGQGKLCALIFDADKKFLVCARFYNPSVFLRSVI